MDSLINWCYQFVWSKSIILEIGIFEDNFKKCMLKHCASVISLIESEDFSNLFSNPNFGESLDLIRVNDLKLENVDNLIKIVENSTYPNVIMLNTDTELFEIFKKIGYKVVKVSGCDNCFFICDHQERIFSQDSEPWSMMYSSAIFDLNKNNYKQGVMKLVSAKNFCQKENKKLLISENISKFAYKSDKYEEGLNACLDVIYSFRAEWGLRNDSVNNLRYYASQLPFYKTKSFGIQKFLEKDKYHSSSPCLTKIDSGYIHNIRAVNYNIEHDGSYMIRDSGNVIRTENYFIYLDNNLKQLSEPGKLVNMYDFPFKNHIQGLEDLRLIDDKSFFCTCLQFNEKSTPQMCYGEFERISDFTNKIIVTKLNPIMIHNEVRCEKNWLPFKTEEGMNFIYSFSPFRIYGIRNGRVVKLVKKNFGQNLDFFRGSSAPVDFELGGILGKIMTVHIVYNNTPRKYFHLFFWISNDFETYKLSEPFYFSKIGIEFNLSLTEYKEDFILCFSVNDSSSMMGFISKKDVANMLK